jgi:uncharacterized membrane protein
MWAPLQRLLGVRPWRKEWQEDLSQALYEAQARLKTSLVVIVARESDLYSELLFVLSFIGVSAGTGIALLWESPGLEFRDLLLMPLLGFAAGTTAYAFRKVYLHKLAPKAVRDRVGLRAKAQFFDHRINNSGSLSLLYLSEMESEALFLADPDILEALPRDIVQKILDALVREYDTKHPLRALRPALLSLGDALRTHVPFLLGESTSRHAPRYISVSDSKLNELQVPILKGTKDIN